MLNEPRSNYQTVDGQVTPKTPSQDQSPGTPAKQNASRFSNKNALLQDISLHIWPVKQLIAEVVENSDSIVRVQHTKISIRKSTINRHLNVVQVTGITMEPELVKDSPDPVDAVLGRMSTLNRQLNRLKQQLDSIRANSVSGLADCHSDKKRVTRLRMNVALDPVCPLEVGIEVASHHRVWRGSISHVVGVVAFVICIQDEDGPVVGGEAQAFSVVTKRQFAAVVDCQEQLVDVGGWGTRDGAAIGGSIADLPLLTTLLWTSISKNLYSQEAHSDTWP